MKPQIGEIYVNGQGDRLVVEDILEKHAVFRVIGTSRRGATALADLEDPFSLWKLEPPQPTAGSVWCDRKDPTQRVRTTAPSSHGGNGPAIVFYRYLPNGVESSKLLDAFHQRFLPVDLPRPSWNAYFMRLAHDAACMGTCARRRVGAVAVLDKRVLATGFNGSPRGTPHCRHQHYPAGVDNRGDALDPDLISINGRLSCARAIHAEANVVAYAAASGVALRGATLYTTTYPCHGCFKQLVSVGIVRVVFDADYNNDATVEQLARESGVELVRFDE